MNISCSCLVISNPSGTITVTLVNESSGAVITVPYDPISPPTFYDVPPGSYHIAAQYYDADGNIVGNPVISRSVTVSPDIQNNVTVISAVSISVQ